MIFKILIFIIFYILANFLITFINSRIMMKKSRKNTLDELSSNKGYQFDNIWDCNYSTIAIDKNKGIICQLKNSGLSFQIDKIIAKDMILSSEVFVDSFLPNKLLMSKIGVLIKLKNDEKYILETLNLKKLLIGSFKFNPIIKKALKNAEDINDIINQF